MEIELTIVLKMEEGFEPITEDMKLWIENEIFVGDGSLMLHSNEIGDTVGVVTSVKNIEYLHNANQTS